jgi:hypothetical protein
MPKNESTANKVASTKKTTKVTTDTVTTKTTAKGDDSTKAVVAKTPAAKGVAKSAAKGAAKGAAKSTAKGVAKSDVKGAVKSDVKDAAKSDVKSATKTTAVKKTTAAKKAVKKTKAKKQVAKKSTQKAGSTTTATSSLQRFFKLVVNDDSQGRYSGSKPKQAAAKALTSILKTKEGGGDSVSGKIKFSIVECTRGSRHKRYNYVGERIELSEPMQVTIGSGDNAKTISYKYNNKVMKDKVSTPTPVSA